MIDPRHKFDSGFERNLIDYSHDSSLVFKLFKNTGQKNQTEKIVSNLSQNITWGS